MKRISLIIVTIAACMSSYAAKDFDLMDRLERRADVTVGEEFNFGGYEGHELTIGGVACKVVEPRTTAPGKPWLIRARFWGHEPQTDLALLERGFHITYCDVADMYGSPAAVARWDAFYDVMRSAGLAKRVALEGMSRGGLIVYNWAAANPSKVACIYADAPVMDIKSWPMGEGEYTGSDVDTEQMLKAYGFTSREDALLWQGNPVDHARVVVKARIPVLHVVGDADVVVPVDENSTVIEKRLKELGYTNFQIIRKPGVGHHPHSLKDPTQIVNFILNATK